VAETVATATIGETTRLAYLYGIVRTDRRPELEGITGVAGAPISFVEADSLTAVVGDVGPEELEPPRDEQEKPAWLERAIRAHEDVLERCLSPGPVLPMRFATTLRHEGDVHKLLREREGEFMAALDRLLGCREWGVKALLQDPAALAEHVRATREDLAARAAELEGRSPGSAYLNRKRLDREIALAGDDVLAELAHVAHRRLSAAAADARVLDVAQPRAERICLNAAYLVTDTEESAFRQAIADVGAEQAALGLAYELTGPWPPYNFVEQEVSG
jgi:Gas vesicle synthesis protein GvpL/GvpF